MNETESVQSSEQLKGKKIAILGAGNMGGALLRGLLDDGTLSPSQVTLHSRRRERTEAWHKQLGVRIARSNADCVQDADIVILAVKPQIFELVLKEIRGVAARALFVSVAAGVPTRTIEATLGSSARVIRAMPNTPAMVHEAATAVALGEFATEGDLAVGVAIFERVGMVCVVDEVHMDAVTGLSGSGPAYVMLIVEAFSDAGVKVGLSREIATQLAVQTLRGSARLLQDTGEHPGKLKDMVTSPGGTAIAGLHTLEEGGLRTTIMNAVEAATRRARELGRGQNG